LASSARYYAPSLRCGVVVFADFFIPKACDAGTGRRATLVGDLALDRVVCKVGIFFPEPISV
jgi:hypothetical protein